MADSLVKSPRPSPRTLARAALVALAVGVVLALIVAAGSALTPFIFGLALAYLLMPIVNRLDRRMPRWAAILLVYAAGLLILVALALFLVPPLVNQVVRLVTNLARPEGLERLLDDALDWYHTSVPINLQAPLEQLLQRSLPTLQENLSTIAASIGAFVLRQVTQVFSLLSFLVGFLIVPIWLFYVLNDARKGRVFINRQLDYRVRHDFWNVWGIVDRSLSAYIRGQLTLGLIVVLVIFGKLFGLFGVILAAPVTAIARDFYIYAHRRLSGASPSEAIAHLPRFAERAEAKAGAGAPASAAGATADNAAP